MSRDPIDSNYAALQSIMQEAYSRAAETKGSVRHAQPNEPFENQKIFEITRRLKDSPIQALLFQAVKKIYETTRTDPIPELLDAMVYLAAGVMMLREIGEGKEVGEEVGEKSNHKAPHPTCAHCLHKMKFREDIRTWVCGNSTCIAFVPIV